MCPWGGGLINVKVGGTPPLTNVIPGLANPPTPPAVEHVRVFASYHPGFRLQAPRLPHIMDASCDLRSCIHPIYRAHSGALKSGKVGESSAKSDKGPLDPRLQEQPWVTPTSYGPTLRSHPCRQTVPERSRDTPGAPKNTQIQSRVIQNHGNRLELGRK